MRTIFSTTLVLGLFAAACGGADEQLPVQAPPAPAAPAPADTTPPAPTAAATPAPAPKPALADLEQTSLKTYIASFTDAKAVAALYSTDATLMIPGSPAITGRDGIQAFTQSFLDSEKDVKFGISRVWMSGKNVACEWVVDGTQAKDWNGLPGNGKSWGLTGASMLTFNDDGLIVKDDRYFDMGTTAAQLGVSKMKARAIPAVPTAVEAHASKGTPDESKNVDAAKALNRTFEKPDLAGFLADLNDDTTYDDFAAPAAMKGKDGAKAFFNAFTKAFPGLKFTESTIFGVEDYTIDEYTMDATQKAPLSMGPGMTIPNTKKTVNTHTLEVLQWKDGKITHGWGYSNSMELMGQLGLLPKPGAAKPAAGEKTTPKGTAPAKDTGKDAAKAGKPAAPKK